MNRDDDALWKHEGKDLKRTANDWTCDICNETFREDDPTAEEVATKLGLKWDEDSVLCEQCYRASLVDEAEYNQSER